MASIVTPLAKEIDKEQANTALLFKTMELRSKLNKVHKVLGDQGMKDVASALADPRAVRLEDIARMADELEKLGPDPDELPPNVLRGSSAARELVAFMLAKEVTSDPIYPHILAAFVDVNLVKERYSAPFQEQADTWIRTPSIVVSRATGILAGGTGGHNLSSKVSEFRPGDVPTGKVKVVRKDGKLFVEFNEADRAKIPDIVRRTGKEADNPELETLLETDLQSIEPRAPRERAESLYPSEPTRVVELATETGGSGGGRGYQHVGTATDPGGWEPIGGPGAGRPSFQVRRVNDTFQVTTADGETFQARSRRSLIDYLTTREMDLLPGEKFRLEFIDVDTPEVLNFIKSCRLRAAYRERVGAKAAAREPVAVAEEVADGERVAGSEHVASDGRSGEGGNDGGAGRAPPVARSLLPGRENPSSRPTTTARGGTRPNTRR